MRPGVKPAHLFGTAQIHPPLTVQHDSRSFAESRKEFPLLEIIAFALFVIWGLATMLGVSLGGAVHALLVVAVGVFLLQRREKARSEALSAVSPAGMLSIMLQRSRSEGPKSAVKR